MSSTVKSLIASAMEQIPACDIAQAKQLQAKQECIFIDVREHPELEVEGAIPGSIHIPRGMLEFSIDSTQGTFDPIFNSGKTFIFYCKGGGRSAMAAQRAKEMGITNILNLTGGYNAWKKAGQELSIPQTA